MDLTPIERLMIEKLKYACYWAKFKYNTWQDEEPVKLEIHPEAAEFLERVFEEVLKNDLQTKN